MSWAHKKQNKIKNGASLTSNKINCNWVILPSAIDGFRYGVLDDYKSIVYIVVKYNSCFANMLNDSLKITVYKTLWRLGRLLLKQFEFAWIANPGSSSSSSANADLELECIYSYYNHLGAKFIEAGATYDQQEYLLSIRTCLRINSALLTLCRNREHLPVREQKDGIIATLLNLNTLFQILAEMSITIAPSQNLDAKVQKSLDLFARSGTKKTDLLLKTLRQVHVWLATNDYVPKRLFFSYAHPLESRITEEFWLSDYLKMLAQHLETVGLIIVWDERDSRFGALIQDHVKQIALSDFVLLFGTPSLKRKYESKKPCMIKDEITEILYSLEKEEQKLIPILLLDSLEHSFPRMFPRNVVIEDWTKKNYVENIKELITYVYQIAPSSSYEALWSEIINELSKAQVQISRHSLFGHCGGRADALVENHPNVFTLN